MVFYYYIAFLTNYIFMLKWYEKEIVEKKNKIITHTLVHQINNYKYIIVESIHFWLFVAM